MHGLAGWFECELAEGVWMTNSPLVSLGIGRPQAFLPIDRPQAVKAGDVIRAPIMARSSDNLIAWEVGHAASGDKFSHSTWTGRLLMKEQLRRSHPDYVPRTRSHTARARMLVLGNRYGQRTVRQIKGSHVARTH